MCYRAQTKAWLTLIRSRDVLHPSRPNCSKDELREKLAQLYKANKDQVSVFGFRTHYGGGKSTGFALIYDSHEAMKKFEPHYRLVRVGAAQKIEKASRQQRMLCSVLATFTFPFGGFQAACRRFMLIVDNRPTGKQRKKRSKEFRGTAKTKGAAKDKKKK